VNRCTYTNEAGYSDSLWAYLEVLFDEDFKYGSGTKY
jgi:hypothetical protein